MNTIFRLMFGMLLFFTIHVNCQSKMVLIKGGTYIPLYGRDSLTVTIGDFQMDVYPVTNEEYLQFVKKYPKWRKSNVKSLFADANYLRGWKLDTILGDNQLLKAPITNISWFAANDYCECQGKRLPTIDEWEYVAMANEDIPDARILKNYNDFILAWFFIPR